MHLPLFQLDAFTDRPFGGNPAAVVPFDAAGGWPADALLASIAAENNLSETAFVQLPAAAIAQLRAPSPRSSEPGPPLRCPLRWFTPTCEVDLCGHATLATAALLLDRLGASVVHFTTQQAGTLTVHRPADGGYTMDFPSRPPLSEVSAEMAAAIEQALGARPRWLGRARDVLAVFDSAEEVRALRPDFGLLGQIDVFAVCATAPGTGSDADVDFVSRFFAPTQGVPEDPVTGSAHCTLTPYWAEELSRSALRARQVSQRVGELRVELKGDRVALTGQAVLVIEGVLRLPDEAS